MSTARTLPKDIVYKFKLISPSANGDEAALLAESSVLSLSYPFDKGEWILMHNESARTGSVYCGIRWKGARMNVLKDVQINQEILLRGSYRSSNNKLNKTNRRTVCRTRVDPSITHGMISCLMEEHELSASDIGKTDFAVTYTISFTSVFSKPVSGETDLAKAAKLYFNTTDHQHSSDVRFVFPRQEGDLEIWSNSDNLINALPYFKALLASDFAEGQAKSKSDHDADGREAKRKRVEGMEDDEDSDMEMDREIVTTRRPDVSLDACSHTYREVIIRSTAYTTYKTMFGYIFSSIIFFAPLLSSFAPGTATIDMFNDRIQKFEETGLPSASPKSIYRLAHLLDIPELLELALHAIESQLTPANVALELFSDFSGVHDRVRRVELDYFIANYHAVKANGSMDKLEERAAQGEILYYTKTSMEVMRRLRA